MAGNTGRSLSNCKTGKSETKIYKKYDGKKTVDVH